MVINQAIALQKEDNFNVGSRQSYRVDNLILAVLYLTFAPKSY
ncbi:hypothetical protein [Calothrix rhizosoleniae]|nr:hypothetical protein [Calothrix rhizosoleniae]